MTIVALGSPETLKQVQHQQDRRENPSFRLVEDMRAAGEGGTLEVWEHLAAEMQKIGYVRVWPVAFELVGKGPKGFTALKQKVVAGAVAECLEKFAAPHYFAGDNLERTMRRIGAIYLLGRKVDRAGFVQASFAQVLVGHGLSVPDYLKLEIAPRVKHEERHQRVEHGPMRRTAAEMFRNAPEKAEVVVRADGSTYTPPKKHKEIVELTPVQQAERDRQRAAEKAAKAAKKAAKAEAEKAKAKNKNKKGGSKNKK